MALSDETPRPARAARRSDDVGNVLVIGLGRFGTAVVESLMSMDVEVLAVDEDPDIVQRWAGEVTHIMQGDSTDSELLDQIGVRDFDRAIVAIGTDIEASVLTVLALSEAGVPEIWAKAISPKHGKILARVGAHHVVYPEYTMGQRVAHLLTGAMKDYLEFDDGYAMARTSAPAVVCDATLAQSDVRSRYGITVVGVKRPGQKFTYAEASTVPARHDDLIVTGVARDVERFCALTDLPRAT